MDKSKWLTEDKIKELYYKQGLSALETARKLNKGYNQIYKFMKRHKMPRRTSAETNTIHFYKSPLSFNKKLVLSKRENQLFQAAMMLYWAEGSKTQHAVDFANSDPWMVQIFLKCLRNIYQVAKHRIKIFLYCHSNQDPYDLINYWSNLLCIPHSQFCKPYIRSDFDPRKSGKMPYGLVHIRYRDRRLHEQIMKDIGKISKQLCQDGGAVNHT